MTFIAKFLINNSINNYCEDWRNHNLHYTNEIVLIYMDKDKISFKQKIERISGVVSKLEEEVNKYVPEDIRKIGEEFFNCARTHLEEKLPKLNSENPLHAHVEYWELISDIRQIESFYGYYLPEKPQNMDREEFFKLIGLALEINDINAKISFNGKNLS